MIYPRLWRIRSILFTLCELPLTGSQVVDRLITDLAVFDFEEGNMKLVELQEGATLEEVKEKTEADFEVAL